jgi:hypothetical protein
MRMYGANVALVAQRAVLSRALAESSSLSGLPPVSNAPVPRRTTRSLMTSSSHAQYGSASGIRCGVAPARSPGAARLARAYTRAMSARATGDACVYVVGMHRSGTSATTGALAQLGLGMPQGEDLVPADESNRRGHFESRSLVRLNGQLIRHFGGTWSTPPLLPSGWQDDPSLDDLRMQAGTLFESAFDSPPMAFKDPRLCITLPLWRKVVTRPQAAVFVLRDPVEVAESLRARSGLHIVHGLAMWDRHVRSAAANLTGLPTLTTAYNETLADAEGWSAGLVEFLATVGIEVDSGRRAAAVAFLDASLHHQRRPADEHGPAESARRLFEALVARQGACSAWPDLDLGSEPGWVSDAISMMSELESLRVAHSSLKRSRAFRLAQTFGKLRDASPVPWVATSDRSPRRVRRRSPE